MTNILDMKSASNKKTLRKCKLGHSYYKSSDCPVCPICEGQRVPENEFLTKLAAPARRALESAGITSLRQLSNYSVNEILQLHGMGKSTIPKLEMALHAVSLKFKK
jgi:predicted RecB family nuclease